MPGLRTLSLYAHALRVARPRQLRARATRPLRRRLLPGGSPPQDARPVGAVEALWRSPAFATVPAPDPATRLGRFHAHYGEDVLEAARAGDAGWAATLIGTWIAANPPCNDDGWHPYPVSTRVGNWIAALTLLPELASPALSESLWRQLRRLERNVEDDVLGNHLVRNARALVLGGVAFGAPKLTRRGIEILRRELKEQILPDGGHYERSPSYHLVVLRDLLEIQGASPYSWLGDTIEEMRRFAAALQRPDGAPALFNDGTVDAPRLELPDPPPGLAIFPDSGFAVVREGKLWLAFRCGRAAPDFLPPHAHADALSLQLWWDGQPVLADPGSFTYEPGPDRDWFRSTRAHSTIRVDGRDQFETWGAFRAGRLPDVKLRYARDGVLEASVKLPGRVRHIRRVEWSTSVVIVRDRLEGRGTRKIESRLVWASDRRPITVHFDGAGPAIPEASWLSEHMDERTPATAGLVRLSAKLPAELGFRITFEG
jgi:uncharacterized heparinase superfamily protein